MENGEKAKEYDGCNGDLHNIMIFLLVSFVVSQALPLMDFHIGKAENLTVALSDFTTGNLDSFSLSGSFNISNAQVPFITTSLIFSTRFTKKYSGSQLSLIVLDDILYSVWENGLVLYDISQISNIREILVLEYSENPVVNLFPVSLFTGKFLISFEETGVFQVLNLTSTEEIIKMRVQLKMANPLSCSFINDLDYVWAFAYNSSYIEVVRFDLLISFTSSLYGNISSADLFNITEIVGFIVYQQLGFVCDTNEGIFIFYIQAALQKPTVIELIQNFRHPLMFGSIFSCYAEGNVLSVATSQGVAVYNLPFLGYLKNYYTKNSGAVQANLNYTIAASNNHLQVYDNGLNIGQALIMSQDYLYTSFKLLGNLLILNEKKELVFYNITSPSIKFFPQAGNYVYTGIVSVNKSVFPIKVLGSDESGIFNYTGPYLDSGYQQPKIIAEYIYNFSYELTLPISNYFSGNNLNYNFISSLGNALVLEKLVRVQSYSIDFLYDSLMATTGMLILGSANSLEILNLNSFSLLNAVQIPINGTLVSYTANNTQVIIESFTPQGLYQNYYSRQGELLNSFSLDFIQNSTKLLSSNSYVFALRGGCIDIYASNLQMSLCGNTINPPISLTILDIAICNGLCVLDLFYGLLVFDYGVNTYKVINLPDKNSLALEANEEFLIVFTTSEAYVFDIEDFSYNSILMPCAPRSVSLSNSFLAVHCALLVVIDLYAQVYANIYAEIASPGDFIIGNNNFNTIGFGIFNNTLDIYSIGLYFPSNYLPNTSISSVWGNFSIFTSLQTTEIQLQITAYNSQISLSTNISLFLYNTEFLKQSPNFFLNSSLLTSGAIDLQNQNFSTTVPLYAFEGNNITYSLQVNKTIISPQAICNSLESVCIEGKTFEIFTSSSGNSVYDYWLGNEYIFVSVDQSIEVYSLSGVVPKYNYTIDYSKHLVYSYVNCMNLEVVNENVVICASTAILNGVAEYFLFVGDLYGNVSDVFALSYQAQWMSTSQSDKTFVYAYDGVGLYEFQLAESKLLILNYVTPDLLGRSFYPVYAQYFNSTTIIIGDSLLGAVFLTGNVLSPYVPVPSGYTSLVNLYSMNESVIMLFASGEGCQVAKTSLSVLQRYPKLYQNGNIPYNMQGALSGDLLVFPIYKQPNTGFLRILNITTGEIFTDMYITPGGPSAYFRRITIGKNGVIYHDLSKGTTGLALHAINIRKNPMVYLLHQENLYNATMALVASTGNYSISIGNTELWYEKTKEKKSGINSNTIFWGIWILVAAGTYFILAVLALKLCKVYRRRHMEQENYIGINESFDR